MKKYSGERMMGKTVFFALLLTFAMLFCCSAVADTARPVNPYRKDIAAFEKIARRIRNQSRLNPEDDGPKRHLGAGYGMNVTCVQKPVLNGTGKWNISLVGHTASQVKEMTFYLGMKDWTSGYSHIYWRSPVKGTKDHNGNLIENPFSSSFTSPKIMTSGEYQVYFYVTYDDGSVAYYFEEFTITGTDALKNKIASVASSCKASSEWKTALNLHDWLTHHLYYDLNYEFYGADSILRGYGVCDSYSKIYYMLCKQAGLAVRRLGNDGHAWNAVRIDGKWYYVDCTWDDPATGAPARSGDETHVFFCLNKTLMALDHPTPWNFEGLSEPSCTSLDANYTVHTGEWKKWGDYAYDYEIDNWTVNTLPEQAGMAFDSGENQFVIKLDGLDWLWYMDGDELKSVGIGDREKAILRYVYPDVKVKMTYGPVKTRVKTTSTAITISLAGWDIKESGTLKLSANLTSVSAYAFMNNSATTLVIPSKCTAIGTAAFKGSKIRTVTIPASVKTIADSAFDGCGRIIMKTKNAAAIKYAEKHQMLVIDP